LRDGPGTAGPQFLGFGSELSVAHQNNLSGCGSNHVLYVRHFGLSSLSVMLYNPQASQSTFIAFDKSLSVSHQYTRSSWDQNSQVLLGAFLDRSRCLASHTFTSADYILVLIRKTAQE